MKGLWLWLRVWAKDSEVIVFARLQMLIGALWTVLSDTDIAPIFNLFGWEKYVPMGLVVIGIITELTRRAREPHDLGVKTVADLSTVMLPIKAADAVTVDKLTGTVTVTKAAEIPADVVSKQAGEREKV